MPKATRHEDAGKKEPRFSSKTIISLFIGVIMVASTAGYAVMQSAGKQEPVKNPLDESYAVARVLTSQEKVYIVGQTGRMLIENLYNETGGDFPELVEFASRNAAYVFVSQALVNATEEDLGIRSIGSGGSIQQLDASNLTDERLSDLICEFGVRRPVDCTLRDM